MGQPILVSSDRRRLAGVIRLAGAMSGKVWTSTQARSAAGALYEVILSADGVPSAGTLRAAVASMRLRGDREGATILEGACKVLFPENHAHG